MGLVPLRQVPYGASKEEAVVSSRNPAGYLHRPPLLDGQVGGTGTARQAMRGVKEGLQTPSLVSTSGLTVA
jgi:hypothetical protein